MTKHIILIFILLLIVPSVSIAKHRHPEKWYQKKWCAEVGGKAEVILPDKNRCDCLTNTHAIELDFGSKWSESVGQSLNYSLQTGKKAGIVLILEDKKDYKYWIRLNSVIEHFKLPIDTWKVE